MKKLLLLVIAIPLWAQAECKKPVDPKKVMLFIDTNYSDLEIATTEKAACERGERLVIVPKNYKEYTPYIDASTEKRKVFEKCVRKQDQKCESELQASNKAMQELSTFTDKQKDIENATKEALDEIKNSGAKLKNLSISGHDGGGNFGGNKGSIRRNQIEELMKDYKEINDVSSILLLGCYTGVQNEVYAWKNMFPNIKIIAGYDGSAPLSDKPFGHEYISDILLKEKKLLTVTDEKKLFNLAKQNIQSLTQMHSALYLQCDDGSKQGEFYYGSENKTSGFQKMDISKCMGQKKEMQEILDSFNKYDSGELEVPKDTTNGNLRQLYTRARRNEHCMEVTEIDPNVNGLFNLLFYEGVKKNFTNFYQEDLEKAEEIISQFDFNEFEKRFEKAAKDQANQMETLKAEIEEMEKSPEVFFERLNQTTKEMEEALNKFKENPTFQPIIAHLETSDAYPDVKDLTKEEQEKVSELSDIISKFRGHKHRVKHYQKMLPQIIDGKRFELEYAEAGATGKRAAFNNLRTNYSQGKRVWVPTEENLKKYSRKETLQNLHLIDSMLSFPEIPAKQGAVMSWVKEVKSTHLQFFQNPFSWHEYTGQTAAPENVQKLDDYLGAVSNEN